MDEEPRELTVAELRPFLTDTGLVHVECALQTYHLAVERARNEQLTAELERLTAEQPADA